MNAYKLDRIERNGRTYKVSWYYDDAIGEPWKHHDGHGAVTEWERRDKKPGELVLCEDRGSRRFYDFQHAVKVARNEGWNAKPYKFNSKREQAAAAARADFEYLRGWCENDWFWCWIQVVLLDDEGDETMHYENLGGLEENWESGVFHDEVIDELITTIEHDIERRTYPVTDCAL